MGYKMFKSVLESLDEIPQKEIVSLRNFVKDPGGKALMIIGKSGTGKTSSVYKLSEEIGYEVYELNASDFRDEESIKELVGRASKEGSLFKGRIILIDDIEGMSGREDRGGVGALSEIIKESRWPIIITATDGNEIYDKKFKTLRSKCRVIKFNPVNVLSVVKILKNVKDRYREYHKVEFTDAAIDAAVKLSQKYILSRRLPDKALDVIDECGAMIKVSHVHSDVPTILFKSAAEKYPEAAKMWNEIQELDKKIYAKKSEALTKQREDLEKRVEAMGVLVVDSDDIKKVVSDWRETE